MRDITCQPHRSYAPIACAAVLLLAFTNRSLTGLCFLLAFGVWGLVRSSRASPASANRIPKVLWSLVAALSAATVVLQLVLQAAYAIGTQAWATNPRTERVLRLIGFPQASGYDLLLAVAAPAFCFVAATREAKTYKQASQRRPGVERQQTSPAPTTQSGLVGALHKSTVLQWAKGYSNPGVIATLSLLMASLSWPSLASLPYLLLTLWIIWQWSCGHSRPFRPSLGAIRLLQIYSAVQVVAVYLWQIPMLRFGILRNAAAWLGLYEVSMESPWQILLPEVAQLVALHSLFVSLGFCALERRKQECEASAPRASADGAVLDAEDVHSPLSGTSSAGLMAGGWESLQSLWPPQTDAAAASERSWESESHTSRGQNGPVLVSSAQPKGHKSIGRLATLVVPMLAGALIHGVEVVSSSPSLVAVALTCFSLVVPSVASEVCLVIGLWVLLMPPALGRRPLLASSPLLLVVFIAWHLAAYTATALRPVVHVPPLLQSLGMFAFDSLPPAFMRLGVHLLLLVLLGGLARSKASASQARHQQRRRTLSTASSLGPGDLHQPLLSPRQGPARSNAGTAAPLQERSNSGAQRDGVVYVDMPGVEAGELPQSAVGGSPRSSHGTTGGNDGSAWNILAISIAQTAWYTGFVVLPFALFAAGVSQRDLLHGAYLLILLVSFLAAVLRLEPSLHTATLSDNQHWLLRIYASLHVVAMYTVMVDDLPGIPPVLQPAPAQPVFEDLGLWHPSIRRGILPVLATLLLATAHASLGSWLQQQQLRQPGSRALAAFDHATSAEEVLAQHPVPVVWLGKVVVSVGALLVVAQAYLLVLWACPRGLLGLTYLALLIVIFVYPPRLSFPTDEQPNTSQPAGRTAQHNSSRWRWVAPALLGLLAAADCTLQYTLAATRLFEIAHVPESVIHFLEDVVGIDRSVSAWALTLRLMRGFSLLGALHLYRFGFAVGTLQAQHEMYRTDPAEVAHRRLRGQASYSAFLKRFLIRHADKILVFVVFGAAMQRPGALGWILVAGLAVLAPVLGGPTSSEAFRNRTVLAALASADLLAATWMIAQYAFQVGWLRDFLGGPDSWLVQLLIWVGLRPIGRDALNLEATLRTKCLLLVAVTLKRRTQRWLEKLPREVKEAAPLGAPCVLFWPPPWCGIPDDGQGGGWWERLKQTVVMQALIFAAKDIQRRVHRTIRTVLRALDWPVTEPERQPTAGRGAQAHGKQAAGAAVAAEKTWLLTLVLMKEGLKGWLEVVWADWGLEVNMLALLIAAFTAVNALSLTHIAIVAVGMAAKPPQQSTAWRVVVLPMLALQLIQQYSFKISLPPLPSIQDGPGPAAHLAGAWGAVLSLLASDVLPGLLAQHHRWQPTLQDWLGFGYIDNLALWALFVAFISTVKQVHFDAWLDYAPEPQRRAFYEFWGRFRTGYVPLLAAPPAPTDPLEEPLEVQPLSSNAPPFNMLRSGRAGPNEAGVPGWPRAGVFMPMQLEAQAAWTWLDWARYLFYRHYTDIVLIAVVALCTLENDVIHATYLAIALYFFRRRESLRVKRNALFRWLPIYNMAVMVLTLAYQSPFENIWGIDLSPRRGCSLAHILGLYKLTSRSGRVIAARGWIADVLLWTIARLQTRIFESPVYEQAMALAAEQQAMEAHMVAAVQWRDERAQAREALEHSRLRKARALRVARLKAGVLKSGGSFGVDPHLLDLDADVYASTSSASGDSDALSDPLAAYIHTDSPRATAQVPAWRRSGSAGSLHNPTATSRGQPYSAQPSPFASPARIPSGSLGAQPFTETSAFAYPAQPQPSSTASPAQPWQPAPRPVDKQSRKKLSWWQKLRRRLGRTDRESYICYALYILVFVVDFGVLTLVFQVSVMLYALITQSPSRVYWQLLLVYSEGLLIAQYVYQIPTRLHCAFVTPQFQYYMDLLGLHGNAFRCIPIFCVYLATLMHTYRLARHQVPMTASAADDQPQPSRLRLERAEPSESGSAGPARLNGQAHADIEAGVISVPSSPTAAESSGPWPEASGGRGRPRELLDAVLSFAVSAYEFVKRTCSASERPLHFDKVQLAACPDAAAFCVSSRGGVYAQQQVQAILDRYRYIDIAAALLRRRRGSQQEGVLFPRASHSAGAKTFSPAEPYAAWPQDTTRVAAADGTAGGEIYAEDEPSTPTASGVAGAEQDPAEPRAAQQRGYVDLSTIGPLRVITEEMLDEGEPEAVSALFQVIPERSTRQNSAWLSPVDGWPIRSLRPAQHTAQTLLRYKADCEGTMPFPPMGLPPFGIGSVHSRQAQHGSFSSDPSTTARTLSGPQAGSGEANQPTGQRSSQAGTSAVAEGVRGMSSSQRGSQHGSGQYRASGLGPDRGGSGASGSRQVFSVDTANEVLDEGDTGFWDAADRAASTARAGSMASAAWQSASSDSLPSLGSSTLPAAPTSGTVPGSTLPADSRAVSVGSSTLPASTGAAAADTAQPSSSVFDGVEVPHQPASSAGDAAAPESSQRSEPQPSPRRGLGRWRRQRKSPAAGSLAPAGPTDVASSSVQQPPDPPANVPQEAAAPTRSAATASPLEGDGRPPSAAPSEQLPQVRLPHAASEPALGTVQAAAAGSPLSGCSEPAGSPGGRGPVQADPEPRPGPGEEAEQPPIKIIDVEWHSRPEQDWYAATLAVDTLAFLYVVLFYQSVVNSARTLADITDERVVPVDFLAVLIILFLFMVLDRLVYTLGNHLGKALLLVGQMALFYWYCMELFWSPSTSSGARMHLRILMALKSLSFAFSALQLRTGYPPPASYRGGYGRHTYVFMRHAGTWGDLGFRIFVAIPFLYELRALLDWSCTPTTLTLFDWLKLEDINTSLFFVRCDRISREKRKLGEPQPRYIKFFQGTLLFLGLLLLLWVPLLIFSSGNPTYQVPELVSFNMNATIGTAAAGDGFRSAEVFPTFAAGNRRFQAQWVGNGSLPGAMGQQYTPDQLKLLCVTQDADELWQATPVARSALYDLLDEPDAAMSFGWTIVRSGPAPSVHGNPVCQGSDLVKLAGETRAQLREMLEGARNTTTIMVLNQTDPEGALPGHGGRRGLYNLFWQLRGDMCNVKTYFAYSDPKPGAQGPAVLDQKVGCNASLAGSDAQQVWWRLDCQVLDAADQPVNNTQNGWSTCNTSHQGPRVVAVVERVQGGFIGQTLSAYGITGLYITVVFGIGRLLRFSTQNIRMRIPYDDLPDPRRLMVLCQDIYIARAEGELVLEEELYWALINIYRMPAVLFELTKKKEI